MTKKEIAPVYDPNVPAAPAVPDMMQTTAIPAAQTLGGQGQGFNPAQLDPIRQKAMMAHPDRAQKMMYRDAFMDALQGWRAGGREGDRPMWRDYRNGAAVSGPAVPAAPGSAPGATPAVQALYGPQAAAGNYGTQLGVIGMQQPNSPFGLPTY
jgi:hypothetical protein